MTYQDTFINALDNYPAAMVVWKKGYGIEYVNTFVERVTGYPRDNFIGSDGSFIAPEINIDIEKLIASIDDSECASEPRSFEFKMLDSNGKVLIFEVIVSPDIDENGKVEALGFVGREVTQRKNTEEALLKSERRYKSIVDDVDAMICRFDAAGNITFANEIFRSFFPANSKTEYTDGAADPRPNAGADQDIENSGSSALSIEGARTPVNFFDLLADIDKEKVRILHSFLSPEKPTITIERSFKSPDGDIRRHRWTDRAIFDDKGRLVEFQSVGFDITDQKRTEESLRESEELYRTLAEAARDMIYLIDSDFKILYVNPTGAEQLRSTQKQLIGKYLQDIFPPATFAHQSANIKKVLETGNLIYTENNTPFPGGAVYLNASLAPVRNQAGKIVAALGISRDITESKKAEEEKNALREQLMHAQKMEAVGQLAGGIAHDFNNMLAVIMGSAEIALKRIPEKALGFKELNRILKSSKRASELSMNLLAFSRRNKAEIGPRRIESLIENVTMMLIGAASKKISIQTEIEPDLPPVNVDANQVEQALLNVCGNAFDAMPNGGRLSIFVETVPPPPDMISSNGTPAAAPLCMVTISDNGDGMPPDVLSKIYEPFFTTKEVGKGTGLGLAVTYGIISNHGGRITTQSKPGEGTTVKILLPFSCSELEVESGGDCEIKGGNETLLIIDDEDFILEIAADMLTQIGYKVYISSGGLEAVSLFDRHRDEISLVVMDMIMPEMDGLDLFKSLKNISPPVKVIVTSGFPDNNMIKKLEDEGISGFLKKPFEMADFCSIIRQTIES